MKKFIAVFLTALLCLTLSVPAFAKSVNLGGSESTSVPTSVNDVNLFDNGPTRHTHIFETRTIKEATCTKNGTNAKICTVCGYTEYMRTEFLGHDKYVSEEYIAPTCCRQGFYGGTVCLRCGLVFEDPEVIPATGSVDENADGICDLCGGCDNTMEYEHKGIISRLLEIFRAIFGE